MSRKGTDLPNPTIDIAGLKFSSRLGVASALWLEEVFDCSIQEIQAKLEKMKKSKTISMKLVSTFATALYMQANLDVDPEEAKKAIRRLSLEDMTSVLARMGAADFEPKDGGPVPLIEEGQVTETATPT